MAKQENHGNMAKNNPIYLIIHHSGGSEADPTTDTSNHTFEIVNEWHRQNPKINLGYPSSLGFFIGYHFFIEKTGKTTQGRDELEIGAHVVGMNDKSIGICLAGNFDRLPSLPNSKPTKEQEESLKKLLKELSLKYNILPDKVVPHRYFANRTCYGKNLPDNWARNLFREEIAPDIEELKRQKQSLMEKIIETLKLLIIRLQNKLGKQRYA